VTKASLNGPATFTVNSTSVNIAPGTPAGPIVAYAGLLVGGGCTPAALATNEFGCTTGAVCGLPEGEYGNLPQNNVGDALYNGFLTQGIILLGNISAGVARLQGSDRDVTAAAIFNAEAPCTPGAPGLAQFTANVEPVVMAVDNNFPDALSGQYLAGQLGTGIVLTGPDTVPAATLAAMAQNGIQTVFIVGGPAVIHQSVINQLLATDSFVCGGTGPRLNSSGQPIKLSVKVLQGPTRYDTNLVANTYIPAGAVGKANFTTNVFNPAWATAFLATGKNFPDALSAGATAVEEFFPVILTDGTTLSQQAINEIADLGIQQVLVMGGPNAVAQSVVTAVQGLSTMKVVLQVFGPDRTATATCLAAFLLANNATASAPAPLSAAAGKFGQSCTDPGGSTSPVGMIWGPDNAAPNGDNWSIDLADGDFDGPAAIGLARGDLYPDALTSGPLLGSFGNDATLVITSDPATLGTPTTNFLKLIGIPPAGMKPVSGLVVFGGPVAVTDATVAAAQTALSQ
jgi:hypothetical protein